MANPSTTGPSGAGTEVLRRVAFEGKSNITTPVLTVAANHIITILSLLLVNRQDANVTFDIFTLVDGSGSFYIQSAQTIASHDCFVWNDKLVITETDILKVYCTSTSHDIYCSYIDQEFA